MITIKNNKLVELLNQKADIINAGRKISMELELMQKDITDFEEKEKAITLSVECKEKVDAGNALKAEIEDKLKQLEKLGQEIEKEKLKAIPVEIRDKHLALLKKKEGLERERNKLALKIQKIKDRLIPIVRREVGPLLKEYEDIETATVNGDAVDITTFSYLEEWKKAFNAKKTV